MALYLGTEKKSAVYVPAPNPSSEIQLRCDMKDGVWKFNDLPITDENDNGIPLLFVALGAQEFYGNIGLTEMWDWLKVILVPVTKHSYLPSNPSVCSVYIRGDAKANYLNMAQLAPAQGFNLSQSIVVGKFGKKEKNFTDKNTGELGKTSTRPPVFTVRAAESADEKKVIEAISKSLADISEAAEALLTFNSGKQIFMLTGDPQVDAQMKAEFNRFHLSGGQPMEALPEGDNQIKSALPPGDDVDF